MAIIPGQSLTAEPKNAPYENPPMYVDPDDALRWHLKNLTPNRTEALLEILEMGDLSLQTVTEGLLRVAVMNGIHSIDVSLLLTEPLLIIYYNLAEEAGIAEDIKIFDEEDTSELEARQVNALNRKRVERMVKKLEGESSDAEVLDVATETLDAVEEGKKEDVMPMKAEKPVGLMSRRPVKDEVIIEEGVV